MPLFLDSVAKKLIGRISRRAVGPAAVVAIATWLGGAPAARAQCAVTFANPVSASAGTTPYYVAAADLDGDGRAELIVSDDQGGNVTMLTWYGTYLVQGPSLFSGSHPRGIVTGDFDRDGRPDVAVALNGSNQVAVLFNHGGFFLPQSYNTGSSPTSLTIGDFNGDGWPDLAVLNDGSGSVTIVLNAGYGTFATPPVNFAVSTNQSAVAAGDFNGDGLSDLAVTNYATSSVSILLRNLSGGFASAVTYSVPTNPTCIAAGDMNGDGRPDLIVANGSGQVSILLCNANGAFGAAQSAGAASGGTSAVAIGDLNGDGRLDVAFNGSAGATVLLGNGNGTLSGSNFLGGSGYSRGIAIGDFNGDGRADLGLGSPSNSVGVMLNSGTSVGVAQQPVSHTVIEGQNTTFSVTATNATSYRWRRNGVPLVIGGQYAGVNTATLTIYAVQEANAGIYDVQMGSACNLGVTSAAAVLSVTTPNACPADLNGDHVVDLSDLSMLLGAYGVICP